MRTGNLDGLKSFLQKDVNTSEGVDKKSALHYATEYGAGDILDFLLSSGANINIQDNQGDTPLHIAVKTNQPAIVQKLLDAGADPNSRNTLSATPIFYASEEVIPMLISKGADVNAKDKMGWTPIHAFVNKNRFKSTRILLKTPKRQINERESMGNTPLHLAAMKGFGELTKLLIENGASVDEINNARKTPIQVAIGESKSMLEKLTQKWGGFTKTDMAFLNDIFVDTVEGGSERIGLLDVSFCPCCLSLNRRNFGCNYTPKHICSAGNRHERLYNLYKTDYYGLKNTIIWCTICGRISHAVGGAINREAHYERSDGTETERVPLASVVGGDVFTNDCKVLGGGGVSEKLRRFYWFIHKAAELQSQVGKIPFTLAKEQLVEACWGARPIPVSTQTMQTTRSFGPLPSAFTDEEFKPPPPSIDFAQDVPTPNTMKETDHHNCAVELGMPHDDNRPTYVLTHNVVDETGNVVYTNTHDDQAICIEDIMNLMESEGFSGRCPLDPANCKGRVYPMDVKGKIPEDRYEVFKLNWAKQNPDLLPKREPEEYMPEAEAKKYAPKKAVAVQGDIASPNPPVTLIYDEDDEDKEYPIYLLTHKLPDGTLNHEGEGVQDLEQMIADDGYTGKCPFDGCEGLIYPADVKDVVSKDFYEKFKQNFKGKQTGGAQEDEVAQLLATIRSDPVIQSFLKTPGVDGQPPVIEPPDPEETCDLPRKKGAKRKTYRKKTRGRSLRSTSRRRNKNGR